MEESNVQKEQPEYKPKKRLKMIVTITIILLMIVIAYGGYLTSKVYNAAKVSYQSLDRPNGTSNYRKQGVTLGKDPISILLVGIENYSTDGKAGRADAQIVVTLNPHTHKLTLTNIPRDWRVTFPNEIRKGYHKINSAYTYGDLSGYGANKLTVQTVEKLLQIPIDKYVAVDFNGFAQIVSALDGVTIDVKYDFWEKNIFANDKKIYFKKGPAHLNGEEALAFVRMRKRDIAVTYTRMDRQIQFIKAAIDQATSAKTIFKVDEISDIFAKNVKTNLKPSGIYNLEKAFSALDSTDIQTLHIDGVDKRIPAETGPYFFVPDQDHLRVVRKKLKDALELNNK